MRIFAKYSVTFFSQTPLAIVRRLEASNQWSNILDMGSGKRDPTAQLLAGFQLILEEMREDRKRADEDRRKADEDRRKADEDRIRAEEDRRRSEEKFQEMMRQIRIDRRSFQATLNTVAQMGIRIERSLDRIDHSLHGIRQTLHGHGALLKQFSRKLDVRSNGKS
jgi:hypothetical protein